MPRLTSRTSVHCSWWPERRATPDVFAGEGDGEEQDEQGGEESDEERWRVARRVAGRMAISHTVRTVSWLIGLSHDRFTDQLTTCVYLLVQCLGSFSQTLGQTVVN